MTSPTYDLPTLQAIVARRGIKAFTTTALSGIASLGLTLPQALQVVAGLTAAAFYKTMPAIKDPGMFQDVYRSPTPNGKVAYIKLMGYTDGRVVVQFKEK